MTGKWKVFKNLLDKERPTYIVGCIVDTSRLATSGNIKFSGSYHRVRAKAETLAKLLNEKEKIQAQIDSELGNVDVIRFMGRYAK